MTELWAEAGAFLAVWRPDITQAYVYAIAALIAAFVINRILRILLKR